MSLRRLLAASVLIAASCASPARKSRVGEDEPAGDPKTVATRDDAVARFFAARGLSLAAAPESQWVALGSQAAVIATIRNVGTATVRIVSERTLGTWPFDSMERARATLHVTTRFASLQSGVQQVSDVLPITEPPTVEIPPGAEQSIRLPLAFALPADVDFAQVDVRPFLHPLAIVVGDEPERVITFKFGEVRIWFAPPEVATASSEDEGPLELALAEKPQAVIAAAARAALRDPVGTIERLMLALPGPNAQARRARCVALEWVTGARLGDSVERWRSWWDSEEGQRFARERRKTP